MKTKLSIIIPSCNEGEQTLKTVESIKETTKKSNYEIIVINDYSDTGKWEALPRYVRVIENGTRLGRPASIQRGIEAAKHEKVLILNARMRFRDDNWVDRYIKELDKEKGLVCSTCVYLSFDDDNITDEKTRKYGANVKLYNKDSATKLLNLCWNHEKPGNGTVNVCLGATTATTQTWWKYIHGLRGLNSWGSADAFLSLKTWMAGGQCRIMTDVEIGNVFRKKQHYPYNGIDTVYNKMYIIYVLFPTGCRQYVEPNYEKSKEFRKSVFYQLALLWYVNTLGQMEKERKYLRSIRVKNVMDFVEL